MNPPNFFAELKRRKVFKIGAAYLVVAWLAVQAASIGFPAFDAPPWALRIFILIALLGFPIAVVMAWVFDITREGVQLDAHTSSSKALFAAAALLVVLALGWYFYGQPSFRKGDVTTPAVADRNSIAVLPFANISGKADEDYFSDGMTEELLNVLAKVPQLKVVARTSVFQFKDKGWRHPRDWPQARRHQYRRRQRATRRPGGADHGAVGARFRWLPYLVRNLRSQAGAGVRASGRNRATHRRCAQGFARRLR